MPIIADECVRQGIREDLEAMQGSIWVYMGYTVGVNILMHVLIKVESVAPQ